MKYSKYKQAKIDLLKEKVFQLTKDGYTTREVEDLINKERSHAWIAEVVKEKEALNSA